MKQLLYTFSVLLSTILFSCSEAGTVEYVGGDDESDSSLVNEDTTSLNLGGEAFLNVYAFLDGPDEWFYMVPEDEEDFVPETAFDGVEELHIIPHGEYFNESPQIQDFMIGISQVDFKLNDPFNRYWGMVKVFYDIDKSYLACEYEVAGGEPIGTCTLLDPDGNVFIEREYNFDAVYVSSTTEPFGAMWELDQANSNLIIEDKGNAFTAEGDQQVVSIMPSNISGEDNNLYAVMSKETFKNEFKINDNVFSGILRAYFHPNGLDPQLYYELPFTNGWLDGEVMIYDDWGSLYLHEIFVDGELDSTVFQLEYGDGVAKPIIYLYPEKDTYVNVELDFDGHLTSTYPKYNAGWNVLAKVDGTLYDETGKEFYALYWEGNNRKEFTIDEGFVIPGKKTAEFLEKALDAIGLNRREANEFIVYWLPLMENNPYNLIHFSTTEYEEMAKLKITPQPETMLRVMMVYQPLESPVEIPIQNLSKMKVERKGFTVVEWGGHKLREETFL
jgi:hypothetical protein